MWKRLLIVAIVAVSYLTLWVARVRNSQSKMENFPVTTVWAWQRPEKLTFIDKHKTAVAVLAETISLSPLKFEPRNQPVSAPDGATYIAVVRIQASANSDLSDATRARVVSEITKFAGNADTEAIQIDFDATSSQRDFYRSLLKDLRAKLPRDIPLSMTALVSWCEGDDWIANLPVDEAVPMYFRMGVDDQNIRRSHWDVGKLREPLCRNSVGISLDEPWPRFDSAVRVYAFAPAAWTETDYQHLLERLAR
ncbi:hypothetical protein Acid345_4529 [Candidatus Koribacter versatilis Ellin345]|uniref:DUF3142 domain-containing protein n=1 Tax=Koribacter versatilis (strain Ellin345) TaxID=204669 RepID=Q1IHX1_KORVE|nr:DUF3142 domain-containing protein [Candidatus Koribacter versatilis]ABF43529.1 hypothetical protein Acid345_4529 [Candidatus Koribacter versatilis Ellin345]